MDLEICLTSEDVRSADAEARLARAWRIIAEMILQSKVEKKPRMAPGRVSATKEGESFNGLSTCY